MGEQEEGTGPVWAIGDSGRGQGGEMVWEGEYGTNTMYTCM
jgi:hypothetical protein